MKFLGLIPGNKLKKSFEKIWQIEIKILALQSQLKNNGYESCFSSSESLQES